MCQQLFLSDDFGFVVRLFWARSVCFLGASMAFQ
jgi:hypothetical protein